MAQRVKGQEKLSQARFDEMCGARVLKTGTDWTGLAVVDPLRATAV